MQATAAHPILLAAPVQATLSQQRVLERLHYVSSFSEQLVIVHGPQGAGKSTLAELYVEQASDYAEVAFLPATGKQSDAQLRSQVLTQLFGTVTVNDQPLGQQMLSKRSVQHAVVVIDNAERLSKTFIAELQHALQHIQTNAKNARLSVVLVSLSSWAKVYRDAHQGAQSPLLIPVEPFAFAEQFEFVRAMLPSALQPSWTQQRHKRELMSLAGYPGEIQRYLQQHLRPGAMDLGDGVDPFDLPQDDSDDGIAVALSAHTQRRQQATATGPAPWKLVLLPILGALLATVLLNNRAIVEPINQELASLHRLPPEFWQTPLPPAPVATVAEVAVEPTNPDIEVDLPPELAISYNAALGDLTTAAAAELSDATIPLGLMRERGQAGSNDTLAVSKDNEIASNDTLSDSNDTNSASSDTKLLSYDNVWALNQPATHYTLQLNRLGSTEWLANFIAELGQAGITDAKVYQTNAANPYWITVYGSYPNIDAARAAIAQLPASVQALQPWPKTFASVHSSIE